MHARTRLRSAAAVTVIVAVTTSTGLLLTGCGPTDTGRAAAAAPAAPAGAGTAPTGTASTGTAPAGTASATPGTTAPGTTTPSTTAPGTAVPGAPLTVKAPATAQARPVLNGTANSRLTISNGTTHVLMNGTSVDFGTVVRDLAWSPDGTKAAFVDGSGSLVVSNPDGGGRRVVARNPGGQVWSHPTWQVSAADPGYSLPARSNLLFAVSQGGVSRLERVPSAGGTPTLLALDAEGGEEPNPIPQTGNTWPNGGGVYGNAVYANTTNGNVYIRDEYLREQVSPVGPGSQPVLSPDAHTIAFVRSSGGHDHIFEKHMDDNSPARDLTPNATTDYTEPSWSPDGRTLAVRTPSGVATLPADGSAAPTVVSTTPGLPAYRG
ncbi:hypothetical protein [Kitasatospora sp. McL0602]|uniref:hypothetical protein n=1 Tax=Kitasatospora sp. McL0602 TaxID=3439530 RepID=UPI003F8CAE2C